MSSFTLGNPSGDFLILINKEMSKLKCVPEAVLCALMKWFFYGEKILMLGVFYFKNDMKKNSLFFYFFSCRKKCDIRPEVDIKTEQPKDLTNNSRSSASIFPATQIKMR